MIFLLSPTALSQTQQSSGQTDNGVTAAFSSTYAGGYPVIGIDTLNLYNGRVSLNLPLGRIGARGSVGYAPAISISRTFLLRPYQYWSYGGNPVTLSQPQFKVISEGYMDSYDYSNFQPGLLPAVIIGRRTRDHHPNPSFTVPPSSAPCVTLTKLHIRMAGGEIELRDVGTNGNPYYNNTTGVLNRGREWHAVDGSGTMFLSDTDIQDETCGDTGFAAMNGINMVYPTGFLMLPDGTRYRFVEGLPIWMRDRNGNTTTFAGSFGSSEVTDSIGRKYHLSAGGVTYKDHTGTDQTVAVITGNLSSALRSDFVAAGVKNLQTLFPGVMLETPTALFNPTVTRVVHLPNGLEYHFFYTEFGELARIEMPSGGVIEYDYGPGIGSVNGVFHPYESPSVYRVAVTRRIYDSPGHLQTRQTFDYSSGTTIKTYDASNLLVGNERHFFVGTVIADFQFTGWYPAFQNARESAVEMLDVSGNVLRRVDNTWQTLDLNGSPTQPPPDTSSTHQTNLDCALTGVKTTLADTNQAAQATFTYDGYGNSSDTYNYDFGTPGSGSIGGLLRRTHTDYNYDSSYVQSSGPRLLNLVSRQWVSADASGTNKQSQTEFEYDNYTPDSRHAGLVSCPNISGSCVKLNDTSTTCLQAADTAYTKRGNLTQTTSYYDIPNSGVVISALQYDAAGNLVKAIDARGNPTTLDYTDRFGSADGDARATIAPQELNSNGKYSYGFATQVTNALGHTAYSQFNYYSGKPVDFEDTNGMVTSLFYDDVLDRPTQIVRAANPGGESVRTQTTISYDDVYRTVTTTSDLNTFNDPSPLKSQIVYDGLGRPVEVRQYETSTAYVTVKTNYDLSGGGIQTSNPYRSGATPLWNTSTLDTLGRVVAVTTPDGAVVRTEYNGTRILVTDQTQKQRMSDTNGLGQLKDVWEITTTDSVVYPGLESVSFPGHPEVAAGYRTTYEYDPLNHLTKTTQGSQPSRIFVYDSVGQLKSASNPESGDINYLYDPNGNLTQKTDAREISSQYIYDALNRNTSVSYTNDPADTPAITRSYDGATNGKGRLWKSQTAEERGSLTTLDTYDALGRPLLQRQQFFAEGHWSPAYTVQRTYDRASHVLNQTYPSGHTTNYSYDLAGQTNSFSGNLGEGTLRSYASELKYTVRGALEQERFGTTTPLYHKQRYNERGQLWDMRLSTSTDPANGDRGAIVNHYSDNFVQGGTGPDNNGNLLRQETYIPGSSFFQDNFSYDKLNRLTSISEKVNGTGTDSFKQAHHYDRWGNRTFDQVNTTTNLPHPNYNASAANNRLIAPAGYDALVYDDAGNLTQDSTSQNPTAEMFYDAENRLSRVEIPGTPVCYGSGEDQVCMVGATAPHEYVYDADGRRVRRLVGGPVSFETRQVYGFDGELLAEYPQYGDSVAIAQPEKEYGYRNGQLLVTAEPFVNVALNKPATQTNNFSGTTTADKAVNGDANGRFFSGSVSATNIGLNSWWQVDLQSVQNIDNITVWGRTDCCPEMTTDFYVFVSDAPFTSTDLNTTLNQAGVSNYHYTDYAGPASISVNRTGRYVRVQIVGTMYLVLGEVQVWTAAAKVNWLVADQLGTPRIIADRTGSTAGISRHDYLPFGEEVATVFRNGIAGYAASDNVRQKFTSQERDTETGLDYFLARYHSSTQGRFTTPDPVLLSAHKTNPQSWNRYSYVLNNPVGLVDPDGLEGGDPLQTRQDRPIELSEMAINTQLILRPLQPLIATPEEAALIQMENQLHGTLTPAQVALANQAKEDALAMVADQSGVINPCRDALAIFGAADPTAALQVLQTSGGDLAMTSNGVQAGPQNVFNGSASTATGRVDGQEVVISTFLSQNPSNAVTVGSRIYLDNRFFNNESRIERAQTMIHEADAHRANHRGDTEFAPPGSRDPVVDGSRRISEIIRHDCNRLRP